MTSGTKTVTHSGAAVCAVSLHISAEEQLLRPPGGHSHCPAANPSMPLWSAGSWGRRRSAQLKTQRQRAERVWRTQGPGRRPTLLHREPCCDSRAESGGSPGEGGRRTRKVWTAGRRRKRSGRESAELCCGGRRDEPPRSCREESTLDEGKSSFFTPPHEEKHFDHRGRSFENRINSSDC